MAGVLGFPRYRASGADLPFTDPRRAHGVAMEGYFWRFTSPDADRALVALIGVNGGPRGRWATLGVGTAGADGSFLQVGAEDGADADPDRLGARCGDAFVGTARTLRVQWQQVALDVAVEDPVGWPRRRWGGSSIFQVIPALNQYWHPWLLGGRATGHARIAGRDWDLDGWQVYAEKNWGRGGFPESWWWGQAHGFDEPDACVAFAGGEVHVGPLRTTVTALVVRLPDGRLVRLGDPGISPVRAEVSDDRWHLLGRGFGWEIEVTGSAPLDQAHVLPVPLPHEHRNTAGALEHLAGRLDVHVRRRGRLVWSGSSSLAALEHGGLDRAEAELRRRGHPPGTVAAAPR